MAQLKDLLVAGPSRFIGDVFAGLMNSNDHLPNVTNTYSLGSSSKIWKQLYVGDITAANTIQAANLTITNGASIAGNLTVNGTINATINGNAATATGFANAKTIALTGDVTGSASGGTGSSGWSIATTIGAGKVTNTMLAGSIANEKLSNSTIEIAGNTVALGGGVDATMLLRGLGLSSAMRLVGTSTTAISDGATTSPVTVGGASHTPITGDVVIYNNNEYVWTSGGAWELLGQDGSFKVVQTAYNSNTITTANASTSLIVSDVSQNTQGVITVTKKNIILPATLIITANGATSSSANQGYWAFDGSTAKAIDFVPGTGISITSNATNQITISSTAVGTDDKVKQTNTTSNTDYRVLLSYGANDNEETNQAYKSAELKFNPNTKTLTANKFAGTATKVSNALVIRIPKVSGASDWTENSTKWTFDGENSKLIDIQAGNGISITPSTNGYTITNSAPDTHYTTAMYLGASNSATTNNASNTTNPYLMVLDNSTVRNRIQIKGSGGTTVTGTTASSSPTGTITISSTDENVNQYIDNSSNTNYRILLTKDAATGNTVGITHFSTNLMFNPSTGLMSGQSLSLTGTLNVTQNATFANPVYANGGLTASDLLVTGNTAFSVTPTAPTAAVGTNNTELATTAFVYSALQSGVMGNGSPFKTARYDSTGSIIEAAMYHTCQTYQYIINDYVDGGQSPAFKLVGKNQQISLLIGSGNDNRGIYNDKAGVWMLYWDSANYAILNSGKFGVNGKNASYNFYVNGTSYFNGATSINGATTITGNTTHNGIVYFANGTTYYINNSGAANLYDITAAGLVSVGTTLTVAGASILNSTLQTKGSMYVHAGGGTSGSSGYVKIAQLSISGTYQDAPVVMEFTRRGDKTSTIIYIKFTNTNGADPTLDKLTVSGPCTNVFLNKSATSTWDLYIAKSGAYDSICIVRFHNPTYNANRIAVAWTNEHLSTAIEGWTQASHAFGDLSWTAGTTNGPVLNLTIDGQTRTATIPSASANASGIVTTGAQTFAGNKTFKDIAYFANSTTNYVNTSGYARFTKIGINADADSNYALYVNGESLFNGHLLPVVVSGAQSVYDLGSAAKKWRYVYAQEFAPDYTYNNSATVTVKASEWTNLVAGNTTGLADGTYIIQLKITSTSNTAYYSGVCSWIKASSSAVNTYSEIPLHAVQKGLANQFYLRTAIDGNGIYLQISQSASANTSLAANTITILFKKIMG